MRTTRSAPDRTMIMRGAGAEGQRAGGEARALLLLVLVLLLLLPLAGCADTQLTAPGEPPTFVVEVSGERFRVQVTDPVEIQRFHARILTGSEAPISGDLLPGTGGFNAPWHWHLDPTTVHVADLTMEVCDGRPSMVEDDLDYWFDSVGRFCPWGARVIRREY